MSPRDLRVRYLWPLVSLLAVFVYFYSLDGLYIPHIGDEAPYLEIARLTAESSSWLPLRTAPGLENTKPPLLFWLGMVAGEWGDAWSLFRLRLGIVLVTLATAGVVFWVTRRLRGEQETAWLGALTFLGFYSSFHYGRPFLTNSPETLFVFSSFALVLVFRERRTGLAPFVVSGLLLGVACLFKSFALVVPAGVALTWLLWNERGEKGFGAFLRNDVPKVGIVVGLGLLGFSLWPLLDPEPSEILRHFVLEENLGKLQHEGYLEGLFTGPYALHWLWLGHFGNAGLFAVPLLALVAASLRARLRLSRDEKALWILVLSFLLVYSVPSQRQEDYLIPTVPALAVLIALRWQSFSLSWLRGFALSGAAFGAVLLWIVLAIRDRALPPGSYAPWEIGVLWGVLALWLVAAAKPRWARYSFHALVFASFLLLAVAVAPFEGPLGRFDPDRVDFLRRRKVWVPAEFLARYERHRFLLPGARIEGYDPADADATSKLLESGAVVVVHRELGDELEGPFRSLARRYDLRSRHSKSEMWRILTRREVGLLVRQELVVRRHRRDRMLGERDP